MEFYNIHKTTFKISDFLTRYKKQQLILSPNFQRRYVWREDAKSYLIDTIIRGLPMPIVILRDIIPSFDDFESKREVVDGQQRLTSIIDFVVKNDFKIKKRHNEVYGNLGFEELPKELKYRILDYEISVQVLPSSITDTQVLEIFSRLNSTGYKLNKQELLNAEYNGEFKTLIYDLSIEFTELFIRRKLFNLADITRMKEAELITDVFVFMTNNKITPRKPELFQRIYKKYDLDFPEKELYRDRFSTTIKNIDKILGDDIENTIFKKDSMFYHLFSLFYKHIYEKNNKGIPGIRKQKLINFSVQMKNDQFPIEIIKASSRGTNNKDARNIMFNFLTDQIYAS